MYNPIEEAVRLERLVVNGLLRKYYRPVRAGRWYGGKR